jgi:hypothetical protein
MARLSSIKTLAGFDFSFQLSLDKNRIMALAALEFIDRSEVVQFLGPPGTGKSHLSLALGVQAIKAGRSVYFTPLSDLVSSLAKADREGTLRDKIRFLCRFSLLIVDGIGYLPVVAGGGNLFFQLVNARYVCPSCSWLYSSQPRMADRCRTVRRREEEVTNLHRAKVQSIGHKRFKLPGNGCDRQLPTRREPNSMTICNRESGRLIGARRSADTVHWRAENPFYESGCVSD